MTARLTTALFVNALVRKAGAMGGFVTVLAHGDDAAGALILICTKKGEISAVIEHGYDIDNRAVWQPCFIQVIDNKEKIDKYLARRRAQDADLWLIELDIPDAERFAADFIASP